MEHEREIMSWQDMGTASRALATVIHDGGYRPDIILAIARGGLLLAAGLGYALEVKNLFAMNVEFYTGVDARLPVPMILPPVPEFVELQEARVLIADDVADTGATLELVKHFCSDKVGELRTAVLYEKPRSIVKCDYVWRRTDRWIDFPWSSEPPVTGGSGEEAEAAEGSTSSIAPDQSRMVGCDSVSSPGLSS